MSFIDYIERLRTKPVHVRKQIAFGASAGFTALVAIIWVTAFTASGALSRSALTDQPGLTSTFSTEKGASLLGAIGALTTKQDGSVEVVGTQASSTVNEPSEDERTVIPF